MLAFSSMRWSFEFPRVVRGLISIFICDLECKEGEILKVCSTVSCWFLILREAGVARGRGLILNFVHPRYASKKLHSLLTGVERFVPHPIQNLKPI